MWNKILDLIKNIASIKEFHKALKTFLLETTSQFTKWYIGTNNKIEINFTRS